MEPGKYYKDGHQSTIVDISAVEGGRAYGHLLTIDMKSKIIIGNIDQTRKFWIINMHQWSKYYEPGVN